MTYIKTHQWALLAGVFLFVLLGLPQSVRAQEVIDSFTSDITINADGSVSVIEEIVYDFGETPRHGIFRTLESTHPQEASAWYKERAIEYEVLKVMRDGEPEPYAIEGDREELLVRIGDANRTITGAHTYRIELLLRGALSYDTKEGAEFYYNITGHEWEVPIKMVEVRVHDPEGVLRPESSCYQGTLGVTDPCTTSTTPSGMVFETQDLLPYEGVTIAQAVDAAKVAREVREHLDRAVAFFALLTFVLLWLLWFGRKVYLYERFYRVKGAIIAQYEPYPDVLPLYTGALVDERIDPKDITAGIVHLAAQGYLRIRKTDRKLLFLITLDDYELELLRPAEPALPESGAVLLSLLFSSNTPGEKVTLSDIRGDSAKQAANYTKVIEIDRATRKNLVQRGFYESLNLAQFWRFGSLMLLSLVVLTVVAFFELAAALLFGGIVVVVYALSLFTLWRRHTRKGYEALSHLRGFKLFLSVTDAERFKFHNAPAKNPELFMEYLPYAIAFGVEKEWAKVFKDVTLPSPSWYDGGSSSFSAIALTSSLNGFSGALATSSSAASGGGSSGGGGGGGGGGSW